MEYLVFIQVMETKNPFKPEYDYFLKVAEVLNISKASEKLGVRQSGLSKSIQRLEGEVGQKLFIRKSHGLVLTKEGQELRELVLKAISDWKQSSNQIFQGAEKSPEGVFKLGGHRTILSAQLPRVLPALRSKFPNVTFDICVAPSIEVTRKVLTHELDFGFVANPVKQPELVVKKVMSDEVAVFGLENSKNSDVIYYNPDMIDIGILKKKFKQATMISIPDYEIIYSLVLNDQAKAILPASLVRDAKIKQLSDSLLTTQISFIYHQQKMKSSAQKALIEAILRS